MFRTAESKLLLATFAGLVLVYALGEGPPGQPLGELRALLGVFLAFVPVGYLFTSALFARNTLSLPEKAALSMLSSYSALSTAYFAFNHVGLSFTFTHSLLLVGGLALLFYVAYLLRFRLKESPDLHRLRRMIGA